MRRPPITHHTKRPVLSATAATNWYEYSPQVVVDTRVGSELEPIRLPRTAPVSSPRRNNEALPLARLGVGRAEAGGKDSACVDAVWAARAGVCGCVGVSSAGVCVCS